MKTINLKDLYESPACRKTMQAGSSKCAAAKVISVLTGEDDLGLKEFTDIQGCCSYTKPNVKECIVLLDSLLGSTFMQNILDINDRNEGLFRDNHELALRLLIEACMAKGLINLDEESKITSLTTHGE